jgi:hypothetical protein
MPLFPVLFGMYAGFWLTIMGVAAWWEYKVTGFKTDFM